MRNITQRQLLNILNVDRYVMQEVNHDDDVTAGRRQLVSFQTASRLVIDEPAGPVNTSDSIIF